MIPMRRGALSAIVIIIFAFGAFAQGIRPGDFSNQAASVSELEVNGLKVIIKRRVSAPTVAGGLFIRGGARNLDDKTAGIENLMLASAIEAGQRMTRETVRRELSRTGSLIVSAVTNDYSAVSFISTRASFDRVWQIVTEVTMNPAFTVADVDRKREEILTQLRLRGTSPEGALRTLQDRVIYAGHPYANEVEGTPANIARFSPADLRNYHKNTMQTSRLLLVIVGDIDPDEMKARVAATLGKLPRGDYKDRPLPALDFSKGTLDVAPRELPTNYVQGSFSAPAVSHPDYFAMRVATTILQSLVYQEVRGRLQLSYAPDASMNDFAANTANISVSTTDPNRAVAAMLQQIRILQTQPINERFIDEIASFFLTRHYLGLETSAAQAGELARYELIGGGWRNSFEFLNGVRRVSAEDIRRVSNTYIKNIRFAVVGSETALNRSVFVPAAD